MSSMNEMKGLHDGEDGDVDEGPLSESSLLETSSQQLPEPDHQDGEQHPTGGASSQYYNLSSVQQEALLSSLESNPAQQPAAAAVARPPPADDPFAVHQLNQAVIQDRLEDLKFALEMQAAGMAEVHERPSPRPPAGGIHFRQLSDPKNESYFQSVSDYDLTAGELESNPSSSVPPSPLMTARTTDRATSPSVASVASGASSVGAGHVRRHLEWDSAADLGLGGGLSRVPQRQAAASLSTLEKLAIGNYSNYFSKDSANPLPPPHFHHQQRGRRMLPPGPPEAETEMRQARLNKFADSLIRQRQLRQMVTAASAVAAASDGPSVQSSVPPPQKATQNQSPTRHRTNRRRRSKSAEKSKSHNATPESSPSRRKPPPSSARHRNRGVTKSTSLTDLEKLAPKLRQQQHTTKTAWEEGGATSRHPPIVVPILFDDNHQGGGSAREPARFRASPDVSAGRRDASQTSLSSSRQSGSRSYETVIDATDQQQQQQKPKRRHHHQMPRVMDSDSFDTEDEMQLAKQTFAGQTSAGGRRQPYFYHQRPGGREDNLQTLSSWTSSGERCNRANSLPADVATRTKTHSSGTTSDEENKNQRHHRGTAAEAAGAAASSTNNNSTMESQGRVDRNTTERGGSAGGNVGGGGTSGPTTIDRAKSFEYFPGETFQAQLQENSSSYEYLPGHLLDRGRPGTVVSNRADAPDNRLSSTHGNEGSTSSDGGERGGVTDPGGCRHQNVVTDSAPSSLERRGDAHLEQISEEIMNRYQGLHSAQVAKMKEFYGKLQHKLDFISEPSATAEDSRAKQAVADKLMRVLRQEEHRMTSRQLTDSIPTPRHFNSESDNQTPKRAPAPRKTKATHRPEQQPAKATSDRALMPPPPPVSSLQNLTSMTSQVLTLTASAKDQEIQRLRINQMKTLRREIRKLEKLETLRLAQEGTCKEGEATDPSIQSSFDSLATDVTDLMLHDRVTTSPKADEGLVTAKGAGHDNGSEKKKDFSQNYPTPRQDEVKPKEDKRQSLAYYLPVDSSSMSSTSSKSERKVLRSVRNRDGGRQQPGHGHMEEDSLMGKENRDILANYMSSLSTNYTGSRDNSKVAKKTRQTKSPNKPSTNRCTLQQALAECRPEFIRKSQARVQVLREIREEREFHSDLCKKWIIQHNAVKMIEGQEFSVPANLPKQPGQRRLFNYNQMVAETRKKYQRLPEVVNARLEVRKRSQENTNRLMALMYKRKLKEQVLKKARLPNNKDFM